MDFYTIHIKSKNTNEEPIAIKEGFNWYSLFFNFFWSIYKKTWQLAIIYIALQATLAILPSFISNGFSARIIICVIYILLAFHANDFYRYSLKIKGYKLVDVILAKSSNHAIYNFLKKPY